MKVSKVLTDFSPGKYSDSDLYMFGVLVISKMTDNAYFPVPYPAPTPSLEALATANSNFQGSLVDALRGTPEQTALKNQKRATLVGILQALGTYVNSVCAGDVAKMLSSGFKVSKQPAPVGPLPKPENFKATILGGGAITLSIDAIDGASSYQWTLQEAGSASTPIVDGTTTSYATITGLTPLKQYNCQVVAIGSDRTMKSYSDTIVVGVV